MRCPHDHELGADGYPPPAVNASELEITDLIAWRTGYVPWSSRRRSPSSARGDSGGGECPLEIPDEVTA